MLNQDPSSASVSHTPPRRRTIVIVAAVTVLATATAACGALRGSMGKEGRSAFRTAMIEEIDANKNGEVTRSEADRYVRTSFGQADSSGDRELTPAEIQGWIVAFTKRHDLDTAMLRGHHGKRKHGKRGHRGGYWGHDGHDDHHGHDGDEHTKHDGDEHAKHDGDSKKHGRKGRHGRAGGMMFKAMAYMSVARLDDDGSGRLSRNEVNTGFKKIIGRVFSRADENDDGVLNATELASMKRGHRHRH